MDLDLHALADRSGTGIRGNIFPWTRPLTNQPTLKV